jgi:hypothetical protein
MLVLDSISNITPSLYFKPSFYSLLNPAATARKFSTAGYSSRYDVIGLISAQLK